MFRVCVCCCGVVVAIDCVGEGNRILACYKASLISLGEALNLILYSWEDKICWVVRFWIRVMVVMLYMWSLLRY